MWAGRAFLRCAIILAAVTLASSCAPPAGSGAKEIVSFVLAAADNPGVLSQDATGEITGASIVVRVPFGVNVTSLVPRFTTTGRSVQVAGTEQVTGQTAHDFSSAVTYRVVAEDGTSSDYTVTVGRRFADNFDRADSDVLGNSWFETNRGDSPPSAASISGNALLLQGGWTSPTMYASDVARSLSLSGTFTATARFRAEQPSANRFLIALLTTDPSKCYFLGCLGSILVIYKDLVTSLDSTAVSVSAGVWHTLTVSRNATGLSVVLRNEVTGDQWSTSTTDSTYQSFATFLLRGGWYASATSTVLSVTADDVTLVTP